MNIKLEKSELVDFFLLYIKDISDINIDDKRESSKVLKKSNIKQQLNLFDSKIDDNTLFKYNQFKSYLKDSIRILS